MPADLLDQSNGSPEPSVVSSWEPQGEKSASALEAEFSSQCIVPPRTHAERPSAPQTRTADDQPTHAELLALSKVLHSLPSPAVEPSRLAESLSVQKCVCTPSSRPQTDPTHPPASITVQELTRKPSSTLLRDSGPVNIPTVTGGTAASTQAGRLAAKDHISITSVPAFNRPSSGKLRRVQAAAISSKGPPLGQYHLRPLQPEPDETMLDGFMMIDACNVEHPELAEVCSLVLLPLTGCT